MTLATLSSKGQLTIPKEVREKLRLKTGDRVELTVLPDGRALLTPSQPLASLGGLLKRPGRRARTVAAMNAAIEAEAADKAKRR
ncbi:MAG: AbrB/MazE/SpoVT family DNA-binding domain-containing protein [Alphaproteobacteria bacterium]